MNIFVESHQQLLHKMLQHKVNFILVGGYADDLKYISKMDFTKYLGFHFWEEPERVDCITFVSGVSFPEAFKAKVITNIEGLDIPAIQYHHLIQTKITSNRLKDKADIEELQKINRHKKQ